MQTDDFAATVRMAFAGLLQVARGGVIASEAHRRVVFLESGCHLGYAQSLCSNPADLVFVPESGNAPDQPTAGVLAYEGGLRDPGDELFVAEGLFVHTQDYLATPFLAVAGPTIVRISGEADYDAFLEDADLARDQGVFVDQLLHPAVFLADQCALGSTHPCDVDQLSRVYVSESGQVRTAPGGSSLVRTLSQPEDLIDAARRASVSGDICLNGVVAAGLIDGARARRPWLSRYLSAIDVLRGLRAEGKADYRVSGFGGRLVGALPAGLVESADAPFLLWKDNEFLVCDAVRGRVFRVGADAARIVELLLLTESTDQACELAVDVLGLAVGTARSAIEQVAANFHDSGVPVFRSDSGVSA